MDLQNIPAIYPEGAVPQPQAAQMQQAAAAAQAAAMAQAAQAQQAAGMTRAGAAAQAAMPVSHRPMRQAGRQLRSTTQLHAVVEACQTVRIACVDEEGPFIVPMSFGYDWADPEEIDADAPRLALWVHSAGVGRKVDAFNREPRVAIEMDVQEGLITGTYACAYSYAYRSIMGTGTIHRIQGMAASAVQRVCSIVPQSSPAKKRGRPTKICEAAPSRFHRLQFYAACRSISSGRGGSASALWDFGEHTARSAVYRPGRGCFRAAQAFFFSSCAFCHAFSTSIRLTALSG